MNGDGRSICAFLSIGSSIAPRENIPAALDLLARSVTIDAVSTFFQTVALERPNDPPFLNGVCKIATEQGPRALKYRILRPIEDRLGRIRTKDRYAPRSIDLDIALYGDVVIDEPGLRIPDPDLQERFFLAALVLELAPDLTLPGSGIRLATLVAGHDKNSLTPELEFSTAIRQRLAL